MQIIQLRKTRRGFSNVELRWRNMVMLVQPFPSSMNGMNSSTLGEKVEHDTRVP